MLILRLALRNLIAHRQRNLTLFLAVGLVCCFVFLFLAFSDGEIKNFRDGVAPVTAPPSDILVSAPGYRGSVSSDDDWLTSTRYSMQDSQALISQLLARPGVADVAITTPEITLDMQAGGLRYRDFTFRAYDVGHDWQVRPYISIKSGNGIVPGTVPQILLHYKAAATLKAVPGDTVTLTGKDLFGQVISQQVRLQGFYVPGQDNPQLSQFGFMNLPAYDLVSGFQAGETLEIGLKMKEGANKATLLTDLTAWAQDQALALVFEDQNAVVHNDGGIYEIIRVIFLVVSILIVFVVFFGVVSVVSVNLYDRKREIGTYYCLGSERTFLVGLYLTEIMLLNVAAVSSGIGLGLLARLGVNGLGIRTEDAALQLVFGGSQFSLGVSLESTLFLVGLVLIVTLVTVVGVLVQRLRVSPVAALRETEDT